MTLEERLRFCSICEKRKMNRDIGIVCSITLKKPEFINKCKDFIKDTKEADRRLQLELDSAGDVETNSTSSPRKIINIGIITLTIGILVSLTGLVIAYGAVIVGILMIIKGNKQKKILEHHKKFHNQIKK